MYHFIAFFYADLMIDICQYYKFDGYLINIESESKNFFSYSTKTAESVNDFNKLVTWVAYITKKIHDVIPGSIIVWYDSVVPSGKVQWQSELNPQNYMFFEASDIFFTDYHWNLDKLKRSVLSAGDQTLKLFHGIDIWGRGAFAGGQFNSWQGCKVKGNINNDL